MLGTLINFSTNEMPFLGQCVEEAKKFSDQIIVSVCDHFFDQTPENLPLLRGIYAAHPDIEFIQYAPNPFYLNHSPAFWHNMGRLVGFAHLRKEIEQVLFLDVDEVVEGERFAKWKKEGPCRLASYWYFREPTYRATVWEESALLMPKDLITYESVMNPYERGGMYRGDRRLVVDDEKRPMVHHYSWVRSKETMLKKVRTWGHRNERNWERLVEEEFSKSFSRRDFVHGYEIEKVESRLYLSRYQPLAGTSKNVTILTQAHMRHLDVKFLA